MDKLVKKGKQHFLAVFGDIKRSRTVDNREMTQRALKMRLKEVNQRFADRLAVPLSLSLGDEFQGLLSHPTDAISLIDQLDAEGLLRLRFGLGWGLVETDWADRTAEMDGSCFHAARAAIKRGKAEDRWVTFTSADKNEDREKMINGVWRLIQIIRDGWTKKQHTAVTMRRGRHTSKATAEMMGLDKSTLSKMLKAAHYTVLIEAEEALGLMLQHHLGTGCEERWR